MSNRDIRVIRQYANIDRPVVIAGDSQGRIWVVSKPGYIWTRDRLTGAVKDYPIVGTWTPIAGKPLALEYVDGVLSIVGIAPTAARASGVNPVAENPSQAPVIPFLPQQKIITLVCYPKLASGGLPSFLLVVRAWFYRDAEGVQRSVSGQEIDVESLKPTETDESRWVVVHIKRDGTLEATGSTPRDSTDTLPTDDIAEAVALKSAGSMPIWAWRVDGDAVGIRDGDLNQDLRNLFSPPQEKKNLSAEAAPGATNDETEGYEVSSLWFYDNNAYICVNNATGAAVWKIIT